MLGDVARDLRLLGYDVAYDARAEDAELLERAHAEGRVLVTRDRALAVRAGPAGALLLPGEGVAALADRLGLRPTSADFLTRCTSCGAPLRALPRELQAGLVPNDIIRRGVAAWRCEACGHVYWEGSHVAAIRARLGPLLRDDAR